MVYVRVPSRSIPSLMSGCLFTQDDSGTEYQYLDRYKQVALIDSLKLYMILKVFLKLIEDEQRIENFYRFLTGGAINQY